MFITYLIIIFFTLFNVYVGNILKIKILKMKDIKK